MEYTPFMQLARLVIENFRRIERAELDFTDALGRVRPMTLLVGPNGAGKTTVLDAIAAAIGPTTELPASRPRLQLSPARVVRKGALHATVTCWLRFSDEELAATREVFRLTESKLVVPDEAREVKLTWVYPDPDNRSRLGVSRCEPSLGWMPLKARVYTARLLRTGLAESGFFKQAGQIVTFDQTRTLFSKTIRRDIRDIIQGPAADESDREGSRRTNDPRTLLLDLAVRSQFPPKGGGSDDHFEQVKSRYSEVCSPRSITGLFTNERDQLDVQFSDGENEYGFDGLSSGEEVVLLFLIKLVSERVHRSVILVDEIELHQHPVWQVRLLDMLPRIGEHNQIIATTHSQYLRDVVSPRSVRDVTSHAGTVHLGALGDAGAPDEEADG